MRKIVFICMCFCFCTLSCVMYSDSVMEDVSTKLTRLHIIANSNSDKDQSIKLAVRDDIIKYVNMNGKSSIDELEREANRYLSENNAGYSAKVQYGIFEFPEKNYENITLPAGDYEALRLVLGDGEGKNWWCVLSPPMCFSQSAVGEADDSELKKRLHPETVSVIKAERGKINIRFKIVELFS